MPKNTGLIRSTLLRVLLAFLSLTACTQVFALNVGPFDGDWSKATTYPVGSIVEYAGSSYIALLKSTALRPDKNPDNWAVFAAAGPAGAIGQTGPAGAPG